METADVRRRPSALASALLCIAGVGSAWVLSAWLSNEAADRTNDAIGPQVLVPLIVSLVLAAGVFCLRRARPLAYGLVAGAVVSAAFGYLILHAFDSLPD